MGGTFAKGIRHAVFPGLLAAWLGSRREMERCHLTAGKQQRWNKLPCYAEEGHV